MATTPIAVICTLDELAAYSLADGNNRYFSLNISVGLRTSAAPGAAAAPILQPWTLKSVTPVLYVDAGGAGAAPNGQLVSQQQITPIIPTAVDVSAVTARLTTRYTSNAGNGDYFLWADAPDTTATTAPPAGESWPRLVAHASTYPAPIPQSLNLAFVFHVPNASVQTPGRIFAAVTLVTADNTTYAPNGTPLKPVNGFSEWQYSSAPTAYSLSSFQAEYLVTPLPNPLPAKHYYDPYTGWIATANGQDMTAPDESNASEDWRRTFERRVAEAFDLGQRMIVVLRANGNKILTDAHLTYLQVDQVRDCVLAALRDTADFGLRYGPDGTNLLGFILARSGVTDPSALNAILTAIAKVLIPDTTTVAAWVTFLPPYVGSVSLRKGQADNAPADAAYIQATLDMLDKVQSALAQDNVLAQLLYAQWDQHLTGQPDWTNVKATVQQKLTDLSNARLLRSRLLLGNIGGKDPGSPLVPIWNQLTATDPGTDYATETQKIGTNLQNLIGGYFHGRFGSAVTDSYSQYFTGRMPAVSWPTALPDLSQALEDDAKIFASSLFPKAVATAQTDYTQPTRASHPVILQIGDTTDAPVTPDQDPERKVSGAGLLIQEQADAAVGTPAGPWTCANMANLYIAGQASQTPLVSSVPAPIRLHSRNKLKQAILAYNNASLVAQDPKDPHVNDFPQQGGAVPPEAGADWGQMFQYQTDQATTPASVTVAGGNFTIQLPQYVAPTDDAKGWSRIPALKYGRQYKLLPLAIGNGGTLPPLMTVVKTGGANPQFTLVSPFAPVAPSVFATNWTGAALQGYTRTVTYKRRVAVGAPRLKKADGSGTYTDQFPAIPAGVVPMARDYLGAADSSSPVLLMWGTGKYSKLTFQVRPPACDLETWDRWVAGWKEPAGTGAGLLYRNTRIYVASAAGRFSSKTNGANGPDISIDDPAVGSLNITLTPVYSDTPAPPPQTWQATLPAPTGPQLSGPSDNMLGSIMSQAQVQSGGFAVACSIGPAKCSLAGGVLTVQVPEGEVWRLTVAPVLNVAAADYFEGFAASASNLGTLDILIESATQGSFAPNVDASAFEDVLWETLAASFDGTKLKVELDGWGDLKKRDRDRDLVRNVELQRQMWRWMGRPIAPLPSDWAAGGSLDSRPASTNGVPNSRLWEVGSFGERQDSDCIVSQMAVNYAYKDLTTTPAPKTSYTLLQQDLSSDMRAQYHRFGITVHSRYEGLAAVTPLADALQVAPVRALKWVKNQPAPGSGGFGFTPWKRCVVPPRVTGEIPKPKILLVIPLTAPDSGPSVLPDLLAIANEPWFTLGGLAEELHAQLDLARDPSVPLSVPDSLANPISEVGPNAILTAASMNQSLIAPPPQGTPVAADPIGTTFDLNTAAPLFGNTCFRVKAPMLRAITGDPNHPAVSVLPASGLERYQAKVRFTRFIDGSLIAKSPPDLESKPTDPFWVEFQPSFQHCSLQNVAAPVAVSDLRFSISGNALVFQSGGNPVVPVAGPPASAHLQLWALLMNRIVDAAGKSQTAALDMTGPAFKTTQPDSAQTVVYLLEVLCEPGFEGTFTGGIANAAKLLFPDSTGPDPNAKARIYRCSAKILHIAAG